MKGKYTKRRGVATKTMVMVLALVLVIGISVGGTLAWLTAQTGEVKNTFTVGDITISLTETWNTDKDGDKTNDSWTGKMVPGAILDKDPKVTVDAGSEACWLFVTVAEGNNLSNYIDYTIADGWTKLEDGVYYREVAASDSNQVFEVLKDNHVSVKASVTKELMEKLTDESLPTLTFKAYAIQSANLKNADGSAATTAEQAWTLVNG